MLLSGDKRSISLLREFGIHDEAYAQMEEPETFSSQEESLATPQFWKWRMSQLLREGPEAMAAKLADQSLCKFSHIPFEEFVRMAYGLPSQRIADFLRDYEFLEVKVYSTFTRSLQNLQLLDQMKQVS
ncbi:hypothetical protein N7505_007753 [Penicillium chrysogenum]|jgi:hypothetical protein|uniref:Uncharacterized protein n=1 Tax=Penicillium chrysogenum TaxID=5076 RepID=A0ABQ8WEI0_PENCH|nr:hypothetical protein N7505_007753 [Penicillium chrysogenum]